MRRLCAARPAQPHPRTGPRAVLMGSGVTSTIRSGIANLSYYTQEPDILAYGMLCVMMATGLWLLIATYWEVSTPTPNNRADLHLRVAIIA